MGSASAKFKEFMDASPKVRFTLGWKDKLANQHAMIWVSLGLMPGNNSSKGSVDDHNRLGSMSDAMRDSDLKTAAHLGRRVAETAQKFGK